jgi:hypothetical protein
VIGLRKGISKNKKANNNYNFFQYFFFGSLEMELLKKRPFKKSEKFTNKQKLYNAPLLKAAFPAYQNFFI